MSITLQDCAEIVRKLTNNNGELISFKKQRIGDGETTIGFLGNHFDLHIYYKQNGMVYEVKYFLKSVPLNNANFKAYVLNLRVFYKEGALYKTLMNRLQSFAVQQFAALCIHVKDDDYIVLENLHEKGYRLCVDDLTFGHGCAMIRSMARLHAASIIYEANQGKSYCFYDHYSDMLQENTFVVDPAHLRYKMIQNTIRSINDAMDLLKINYDVNIKTKLAKYVRGDVMNHALPSSKYRNVISHADLWKNNMMFRSAGSKKEEEEIECVLVDFQFVRYAPPAFDLLTALHVNYKSEFLQLHKRTLIDLYYQTFSDLLIANGVRPETTLTCDEFAASLVEYELPSLVASTMFSTIIFLSDELSNAMVGDEAVFDDYTYVDRSKYVIKEFAENARFRDRFGDVLQRLMHCLQQNVINY